MRSLRKTNPKNRLVLFAVLELALIGLCWWGIHAESQRMNQAVNDLSDLKDPSPFRAALMGYLGKIHVGMEGYLRSSDPGLLEQVAQSRKDFEGALPEFEKQNPKLFPKTAVEEIQRSFTAFKEAIDQTLAVHGKRDVARQALDQNFARIVFLIEKNIRPLIRTQQAESDERADAILNVENQARAWQQNLAKAWAQPSQQAMELTYENDNRGGTYLERYARMELLHRERNVLKEIRGLWQTTSDSSRASFAIEKTVTDTEKFMTGQRERVVSVLNRYLPALPPAELEARKRGFAQGIRLHSAAAILIGALAVVSFIALVIFAYRQTPRGAKEHKEALQQAAQKEYAKAAAQGSGEPTLEMDLKGQISKWTPEAEKLYGYRDSEMVGQTISKLFESESEISRLYKDLLESPKTLFQTTHRTKHGDILRVHIEFRPVADQAGHATAIGLLCIRK